MEIDCGVAERREPGDVGRVGLVSVDDEVDEGGLDVHGLPEHDHVDHKAQGAQLVLLSGLIVLAQLAAGTVEHVSGQAVAALAPAEDAVDGMSSGDFAPALSEFFGSAAGLSASVVTRLTVQWQDEHARDGAPTAHRRRSQTTRTPDLTENRNRDQRETHPLRPTSPMRPISASICNSTPGSRQWHGTVWV